MLSLKSARILAAASTAVLAWGLWVDVVNSITRLAVLAGASGIVASVAVVVVATRRSHPRLSRLALAGLAAAAAAAAAVAFAPVRAARAELRAAFVSSLVHYDGVKYVWGGEGGAGIDCSGLLRRAWRDALVERAVADADIGLVRLAVQSFFVDATAKDMRDGKRGNTSALSKWPRLRDVPREQRRAGDMVATSDGTHIMAFVEGGRVIEADPLTGRVTVLDDTPGSPTSTSPWLESPVEIVSWSLLESADPPM